jgi:hypothetical protein
MAVGAELRVVARRSKALLGGETEMRAALPMSLGAPSPLGRAPPGGRPPEGPGGAPEGTQRVKNCAARARTQNDSASAPGTQAVK